MFDKQLTKKWGWGRRNGGGGGDLAPRNQKRPDIHISEHSAKLWVEQALINSLRMLSPFFIFFFFLFGLILLSNSPPSPVLSLQQANSNNGNATSLINPANSSTRDTGGLRDTSVLSLWNSSIRLAKKKGAHRVMHWSKENLLRKSFFQLPHNTIQILCEN